MRNPRVSSVDALSNLPVDIIYKILACLPLKDAVRTSLLSRGWRYKWMSIPELVFDYHFDETFFHCHILERIIYQVLLHHQGSINRFALQVPSYRSGPDIDHWIFCLIKYKVQHFTLHICIGNSHRLPSHFFEFQHLMHLNLYRCVFEPPPRFQGFRMLNTLDYQKVIFVPKIFRYFISRCLLLERMRLVDCTDLDSFEVEAPCLRFFTFHGVFKSISFKNCPVLLEVSLSTPINEYRGTQSSNWIKRFDFLPTLEKLHLQPRLLQFLLAGTPNWSPGSFMHLKFLSLSMYLDSIEEVACVLCLARSSPDLQTLKITLYASNTVRAVIEFIQSQEIPGRLFNRLKRVDISGFSCGWAQMAFVKFLLASAIELKNMVILPSIGLAAHKRIYLMEKLKQFTRASPRALVRVILNT